MGRQPYRGAIFPAKQKFAIYMAVAILFISICGPITSQEKPKQKTSNDKPQTKNATNIKPQTVPLFYPI
jgi:hypothetical protein